MTNENFKIAYAKVRALIDDGKIVLKDYEWTAKLVEGRICLWPLREKLVKLYP